MNFQENLLRIQSLLCADCLQKVDRHANQEQAEESEKKLIKPHKTDDATAPGKTHEPSTVSSSSDKRQKQAEESEKKLIKPHETNDTTAPGKIHEPSSVPPSKRHCSGRLILRQNL